MNKPKLPLTEENIDKVLGLERELLVRHSAEISDILEEYETRKVTCTIKIQIDASEPTPDLGVVLSVPRRALKDTKGGQGEDPAQERLALEASASTTGAGPKRRGRKQEEP